MRAKHRLLTLRLTATSRCSVVANLSTCPVSTTHGFFSAPIVLDEKFNSDLSISVGDALFIRVEHTMH